MVSTIAVLCWIDTLLEHQKASRVPDAVFRFRETAEQVFERAYWRSRAITEAAASSTRLSEGD